MQCQSNVQADNLNNVCVILHALMPNTKYHHASNSLSCHPTQPQVALLGVPQTGEVDLV